MASIELVDVAMRLVERAETTDVAKRNGVRTALESCEDALECLYAAMLNDEPQSIPVPVVEPQAEGETETELRAVIDKQVQQLQLLMCKTTEMREENSRLIELLEQPLDTSGVLRPAEVKDAQTDNPHEDFPHSKKAESIEREVRSQSRGRTTSMSPAGLLRVHGTDTAISSAAVPTQEKKEGQQDGQQETGQQHKVTPPSSQLPEHEGRPVAPVQRSQQSVGGRVRQAAPQATPDRVVAPPLASSVHPPVVLAPAVLSYRYSETSRATTVQRRVDTVPVSPAAAQSLEWGYRYTRPGATTSTRAGQASASTEPGSPAPPLSPQTPLPPTAELPVPTEAEPCDAATVAGSPVPTTPEVAWLLTPTTAVPAASPARSRTMSPSPLSPPPGLSTPPLRASRRAGAVEGPPHLPILPAKVSQRRASYFQTGDLRCFDSGALRNKAPSLPSSPLSPMPTSPRRSVNRPLRTGDLMSLKPASARSQGLEGSDPPSHPPTTAPSEAESRRALDSFLNTVRPAAGSGSALSPTPPSAPARSARPTPVTAAQHTHSQPSPASARRRRLKFGALTVAAILLAVVCCAWLWADVDQVQQHLGFLQRVWDENSEDHL